MKRRPMAPNVFIKALTLLLLLYAPPSSCDCIVGPELLPNPLSNVGSYLQIFTSIRFPCSGKIVRWNFYSRAVGTPVYFGVWEAINATTFRLVDYNRIVPNRTGLLHEEIYDPTEFINVTPGLYLGVHYDSIDVPQNKQVIPYADAIKPDPYTVLALSDGFPVGVGHNQIIKTDGFITFTGILFKQWRLPALQASVKFLIDCGKPPVLPSSKVTFKATLAFSTAVYQCNSGFRLVGNPISTCQSSGLWSAPPICDINDLCFAGPDLYDNPLESASSLLQLFPAMTFTCGGFIGRWWFYSRVNSRNVYLSVWRQVMGTNSVKLVGANRILAARRGLNYFRVPEDDMIFVEPGDFIGLFYDRPDLPMTDVVVPYAGEHVLFPYTANDLSETLLLPMGKVELTASNGVIDLTRHADGAIAYWRIPAFRGYIINIPVCPQPPLVAYSTIAFSSTKIGAMAVYSCMQGYTIYGQNPIKCLPSQKWSGAPECRLIPRCQDPPGVDNALAYFNSTTVGSYVTYFCKAGFVIAGQNPITCLTNLTWTKPLPRCHLSSTCPPPPVLMNGLLSMTGTLQPKGAVAFYTCKPGFVMVGSSSVFCTDDKSWSTPPVCAPALSVPPEQQLPGVAGGTGPSSWQGLSRPPTKKPPENVSSTGGGSSSWSTWTPTLPITTNNGKQTDSVGNFDGFTTESTTNFVSFNVPSGGSSSSNVDVGLDTTHDTQQPSGHLGQQTTPMLPSYGSPDDYNNNNNNNYNNNNNLPSDYSDGSAYTYNGNGLPGDGSNNNNFPGYGAPGDGSANQYPGGYPGNGLYPGYAPATTPGYVTQPPYPGQTGTAEYIDFDQTTDDSSVLVLTKHTTSGNFYAILLPAVIIPILLIILIVFFAIAIAWFRYKRSKAKKMAAIDYNSQPFYENIKNGYPGGAESVATGYARGSYSDDGYDDDFAGNYSTKTESNYSIEELMQSTVVDTNKRQPNFFMAPAGLGPTSTTHRSAGAVVIPPPPPPLPPPPGYYTSGRPGTLPRHPGAVPLSYNNGNNARGHQTRHNADHLPTISAPSTMRRKR